MQVCIIVEEPLAQVHIIAQKPLSGITGVAPVTEAPEAMARLHSIAEDASIGSNVGTTTPKAAGASRGGSAVGSQTCRWSTTTGTASCCSAKIFGSN